MKNTRRDFLLFLGASSYSLAGISALSTMISCTDPRAKRSTSNTLPSFKDDLVLAEGFNYYPIISWGDKINNYDVFGFNNDFITYKTLSSNELIMWVNHEYTNSVFVSGHERTKENVDTERRLVGGSIIKVKKENSKWKFISNDPINKGVRADTPMTFANGVKVKGTNSVEGTCSNCAGGYTPWDTFLTCEENTHKNYGEYTKEGKFKNSWVKWEVFYPHPVEHFGWVVEVDPMTGSAQKHTNLGRFGHESATCKVSKSGHVVVYSGDDKENEHLYKFVSKTKTDFKEGVLYVANLELGKWLPLDLKLSPILQKHFKTHIDLMINTRKASKILGGTELNRPEDIEVHPITGDVYTTLTKSKSKNDKFGSILKISEENNDHSSTTFKSETFKFGGELSKFSCPDNLAFDQNGNLWLATDISGGDIGNKTYSSFGNNGLFVIPTMGSEAGNVIQIASAPVDAEFTGLSFSPDQKTLFISVQHPGERTKDINNPTSHWPTGKTPKPTVVAIEGSSLEKYTQKKS